MRADIEEDKLLSRKYNRRPILKSKRALRKRLAGLPIEEKLALLDALRHRALTIRKAAVVNRSV